MSDVNVAVTVAVSSPVSDLINSSAGIGSGSWVVARGSDQNVAGGWLVIEDDQAGADRWCAVISADPVSAVAAGPVSQVELSAWSVPDGSMPSWVVLLASAQWDIARARSGAEQARRALDEHRNRLEAIVDAAHEYADDNDLCSRFDDFMIDQGLRARSRDYAVSVDVRLRVSVTESGHDADSASGNVDRNAVAEAIYNLSCYELRDMVDDFDVIDVERI